MSIPILPQLLADSICLQNKEKQHIEAHGVRIKPPFIEFKHAYEGRIYKQKIVIQNISSSNVCVRITPPSSFAYKIKCVKNRSLSPGLCLVREIIHIHSHATSDRSIVPIFIDGNCIEYEVITKESAAEIAISPKTIDLGIVDLHVATNSKILEINNIGSKMARFFVDTRYNADYKIITDPRKGYVQPKCCTKIYVKLISDMEGEITDWLWIKCDKLHIIPVTVTVIRPTFEIIDRPFITSFTIINFPTIYVGLQSTEILFIRNYSAFQTVFCIVGDIANNTMDLKQCQQAEAKFRHFNVSPQEGTFQSKELKPFTFYFKPIRPKPNESLKPFYLCALRMYRLKYKYLSPNSYQERLFLVEEIGGSIDYSWNTSMLLEPSRQSFEVPKAVSSTSLLMQSPIKLPIGEYRTFYLHAVAEQPSVQVVPDSLHLTESLTIGQQYTRVLEFTNHSKTLPIYVWYQKSPHVEVDNYKVHILPTKSIQVTVTLTPRNIECVNTVIRFDLKYHNVPKTENDKYEVLGKIQVPLVYQTKVEKKVPLPEINKGIAPNYIREAGKFCHNVKFKSKVVKPRAALIKAATLNKNDLIAFPNDLQKSLRPWRGDRRVKTIFTKAPRYIAPLDTDYEMTLAQKKKKLDTGTYYTNYTRKEAQKLRNLFKAPEQSSSNYDLTETNKILCEDIRFPTTSAPLSKALTRVQFLTLSPLELYKIMIEPTIVKIGKVAIHSRSDFTVSIRNGNPFPIRIYFRPEKTCIGIPGGTRRIIQQNSECNLMLTYISGHNGFYTSFVDVIINECCVFVVNIEANVNRPYLTTDVDVIEFDDGYIRYIQITNPLNSDICFKWKIEYENFQIKPVEGLIKANCKMSCEIVYLANQPGPSVIYIELLASEIPSTQIKLVVRSDSTRQGFPIEKLYFTNVPLNIPITKTTYIKNDSPYPKSFSLYPSPSNYIQVIPTQGIIYSNSYAVISITLKMTACVKFSEKLRFEITDSEAVVLHVVGNVVYPDVTVTPQLIQFHKIPSSSIDTVKFVVANKSDAKAFIKFDISSYTEYTITEANRYWWSSPLTELVLTKHSSKELYMHFTPNNIAYDNFFLPMIINDILGPVTDNLVTSQVSFHFDRTRMRSKTINVPKTLPILRVASHSAEPKLQFSKLKINLNVCTPPYAYKNSYNLKITNVQKEAEEVCIRTDGLCHPFSITQISGPTITTYPNSMVYVLNPNEQIVFQILFEPSGFGTEEILLPIFLRSDQSSEPHNALQITGRFDPPIIAPISFLPFYKPGPLNVRNIADLKFMFKHHFSKCKISFDLHTKDVSWEIFDNSPDSTNSREVTVKMELNTEKPVYSIDYCRISCTCGVSQCVPLPVCGDNCFLTNYSHVVLFLDDIKYNLALKRGSYDSLRKTSLMSIVDTADTSENMYDVKSVSPEYPFFPGESDPMREFSEYSIKVLESWIYTQVFYSNTFYEIPTGITYIIFDESSMPVMPYINLLINLGGKEVEEHFQLKPAPEDNVGRTKYLYDIYEKALQFLIDLGGRFGYIRPEHLLDFVNYRLFMTHFKDEDAVPPQIDISDAAEYCALVKQAWLDVLFQTYKVMVLQRLILGDKKVVTPLAKTTCPNHIKYMNSIKNIAKNQHLFSITELLLLDWMRFHYNEIRQTFWKEHTFMNPKDVTCFDDGIHDGFIFAALTISYCPYLIGHFDDMFFDPIAPEEFSHNNIKVILAWQILNFSYKFTVRDLERGNPTQTLFLAVYLYQLLPDMYPSQTIAFEANLSQRTQKSFTIRNANDFPVAYKATLYGSDDDCFKVDKELYVIQSKQRVKVYIDYWAKFIKESKCTLILSGECRGYRYARSMVVSLIGVPNVEYVTDTYELNTVLYTAQEIQITVSSPYKEAALYKIQESHFSLRSWAEVEEVPYRTDLRENYVLRITTLKSQIDFDDDGVAIVDCCVCLAGLRIIPLWIFFRNPQVGDFCIKIVSGFKMYTLQDRLIMNVPPLDETTSSRSKQGRIMTLNIPCMNRLAWQTFMKAFVITNGEDFDELSKQNSQNFSAMHVLGELLRVSTVPYKISFCAQKRYFISPPKNCPFIFPKYVDIEDECSMDFIPLPVELKPHKAIPKSIALTLIGEDGFQIRNYNVILQSDNKRTNCDDNVPRDSLTVLSEIPTISTDTTIL